MNNLLSVKFSPDVFSEKTLYYIETEFPDFGNGVFSQISDFLSASIINISVGGINQEFTDRHPREKIPKIGITGETVNLRVPVSFKLDEWVFLYRCFYFEFLNNTDNMFTTWVTFLNEQEVPQWTLQYNQCQWTGDLPLPEYNSGQILLSEKLNLEIQALSVNEIE